jgi:hypothetical protein
MKPKRNGEDLGFDHREMEFLVEMSRDCYPISAFDEEVQFYLDQLYDEDSK